MDLPAQLKDTPFAEPTCASGVFAGWWPLLIEAHERISGVDPGYRVAQFKEKFGSLRLYIDASQPELYEPIREIVSQLETRAASLCDLCGEPGKLRGPVVLRTRCEQHADTDWQAWQAEQDQRAAAS